jgi:hypothetical protein
VRQKKPIKLNLSMAMINSYILLLSFPVLRDSYSYHLIIISGTGVWTKDFTLNHSTNSTFMIGFLEIWFRKLFA